MHPLYLSFPEIDGVRFFQATSRAALLLPVKLQQAGIPIQVQRRNALRRRSQNGHPQRIHAHFRENADQAREINLWYPSHKHLASELVRLDHVCDFLA